MRAIDNNISAQQVAKVVTAWRHPKDNETDTVDTTVQADRRQIETKIHYL